MSVFAVVLVEPNDTVMGRLVEAYPEPDHVVLTPTFAVVSADGISSDVAKKVGITGDNRVHDASGAVFQLTSSYAGHTRRALWEWLNKHEDQL